MTHYFLLPFFLSFVPSSSIPYFSTMISNYRASVGWLNWVIKKKWKPSLSNCGTEPEFICRCGRKRENYWISSLSNGTQWIQFRSATAVQDVRIIGRVTTWSNVVSYLARVIFNDKSIQMSYKQIRIYFTVKRKTHNNLGHKEHKTHSSQPHSLFVDLSQTLNHFPASQKYAKWRMWKREYNLFCKCSICSTIVYFVFLYSNANNYHEIEIILGTERQIYFFFPSCCASARIPVNVCTFTKLRNLTQTQQTL